MFRDGAWWSAWSTSLRAEDQREREKVLDLLVFDRRRERQNKE